MYSGRLDPPPFPSYYAVLYESKISWPSSQEYIARALDTLLLAQLIPLMSRMDQKANFVASILMRFTHCNLRLHDWQLIANNYKYDVTVPVSISLWAIVHSVATWSPNAWCLVADCGAKTCALNWGGTMYMYVHALPSAPGFSLCVEFIFVHKGRERESGATRISTESVTEPDTRLPYFFWTFAQKVQVSPIFWR